MATDTINAIETYFDGWRFRSRTEARWAVFFKTAGIPFEYELEGFNLGGIRYLPDFWLPEQNCWVEIKPDRQEQNTDAEERARRLAKETGQYVYIMYGTPRPLGFEGDNVIGSGHYFAPDGDWESCAQWGECHRCGHLGLGVFGYVGEWGSNDVGSCVHYQESPRQPHGPFGEPTKSVRLAEAYAAAKSARFEFGS